VGVGLGAWTSWRGTPPSRSREGGARNRTTSQRPDSKSTDYETGSRVWLSICSTTSASAQASSTKRSTPQEFHAGGQSTSVGGLYNIRCRRPPAEPVSRFVKEVLFAASGAWPLDPRAHPRVDHRTRFHDPSNRMAIPSHIPTYDQERSGFADHRFRSCADAHDAILRDPPISGAASIDVKLQDGRTESDNAWLMTMRRGRRPQSELQRWDRRVVGAGARA